MQVQTVERPGRVHLLVFDAGDDLLAEFAAFARREDIRAAHFTGIGALQRVTLAHYDPASRDYREIALEEQVELIALTGNISRYEDGPRIHAHALVSRPDGTALAGHLVAAEVRPTLELFVTALPAELERRMDDASGLPLIVPRRSPVSR